MKIAVASDHRGIDMKQKILDMIRSQGEEAIDYGPNSNESVSTKTAPLMTPSTR